MRFMVLNFKSAWRLICSRAFGESNDGRGEERG